MSTNIMHHQSRLARIGYNMCICKTTLANWMKHNPMLVCIGHWMYALAGKNLHRPTWGRICRGPFSTDNQRYNVPTWEWNNCLKTWIKRMRSDKLLYPRNLWGLTNWLMNDPRLVIESQRISLKDRT